MQKLQMFAWQSNQRGHNVHIQANPTAGELLHREFNQKKEVMKDTSKVSILEKYGGEQHLERLPRELLAGQTEECESTYKNLHGIRTTRKCRY
jgi:pre-mRNA-processing factor SLU7